MPAVKRWVFRLFLIAMAVCAVLCIVYTGSRSGYIGTLAVIFFWWAFSRHRIRGILVGMLLGALVVLALPEQYKERFESIGGKEKEGSSKESRIEIVRDALIIFQDNPFGVGVDCFRPVRMQYFGRYQGTHNLYLQVATHLGIQGFMIFMFFVGTLVWAFQKSSTALEATLEKAMRLVRQPSIRRQDRASIASLAKEIEFVLAVSRAGRLYLFMLIVNGAFAHTLYLICWWFLSGAAISVLNLAAALDREVQVKRRLISSDTNAGELVLQPWYAIAEDG